MAASLLVAVVLLCSAVYRKGSLDFFFSIEPLLQIWEPTKGWKRLKTMQSDLELLRRIDKGDEDALGELYDLYYKLLSRFVLGNTHDVQLTLEIINDVFMVVWDKAGSFRGDSAVSTWMLGIAYKKALKPARNNAGCCRWMPSPKSLMMVQ